MNSGGSYTLKKDIQAPSFVETEGPYGPETNNLLYNINGVDLDLGGHTISGTTSYGYSLLEEGDLSLAKELGFIPEDADYGPISITNGTFKNFVNEYNSNDSGDPLNFATGGVISNFATTVIEKVNANFENNSAQFGGAIINVATVLNGVDVPASISNISGNFNNNRAEYFGGAILNSIIEATGVSEDYMPSEVLTDVGNLARISIVANKNTGNTVFSGNTADVIGGAIANTGVVDIFAYDNQSVIFETESDDIYNVGALNINSGNVNLNSSISNKEVEFPFFGKIGGSSYGITNIADGATLTLGNGATITQKEINVDGALYAANSGALTGKLAISGTGTADLNADSLTSTVYNDGDLALWDGTLNQDIVGNGITAILGEVTNNAMISQDILGIEKDADFSNGVFTTHLDNLDIAENIIHNYGTLKLTGGSLNYDITSTDTDGNAQAGGKTIIAGDVASNALISQADLDITDKANLTIGVDKLDILNVINNDGTLTLDGMLTDDYDEGYHLAQAVSGNGKTVFNSGNTFVDNDVLTEIEMIGNAAVSKKFGKEGKGILITSTGKMRAEAGSELLGNLKLEQGAEAQIVDVASLKYDVTNNGDLLLNNGTLNKNITGNGDLNIQDGTVINNATIKQTNLLIEDDESTGTTFITNADNLNLSGEIRNAATLKLTGGKLVNDVVSAGQVVIDGDVVNEATIAQNVNVLKGYFESNGDNVTGVVNVSEGASYDIFAGTLRADSVSGNGTLVLSHEFTSVPLSDFKGQVNVTEDSVLTIANNTDVFANANEVKFENGSTLSLLGEANDVVMDNLVVSNGHVVNLKLDWGDKLNSSSAKVDGTFNVTEIDMSSTAGTSDDYQFTSTLFDKIALSDNLNLLNVTDETNNLVSYSTTDGYLTYLASKKATLDSVFDEATEDADNIYAMTDEEESMGSKVVTTDITIQGSTDAGNTSESQSDEAVQTITAGHINIGSNDADNPIFDKTLTIKDVNIKVSVADTDNAAIEIKGNNELVIKAEGKSLTLSGNGETLVYLDDQTAGKAKATIEAAADKVITIADAIKSNHQDNKVVFKGLGKIFFGGLFDPATADVETYVERSGYDDTISYNINNGGTLKYTSDKYLYDAAMHGGTYGLNSINLNGGTLDLRNNEVNVINLSSLALSDNSNIALDIDLVAQTTDELRAATVTNTAGKTLSIVALNVVNGEKAANDTTTVNFNAPVASDGSKLAVTLASGAKMTATSAVFNYNAVYDATTEQFTVQRFSSAGGYGAYNPNIMASPIAAQIGGYLTQLNSYDQAFRNMDMYMLMTQKQRNALKYRNKFASADSKAVYAPTNTAYEDKSMWFRPFATFENVPLKNGPRVSNVAYGSYFGGESELYDLGHGWDGMFGVYAGYNGSHQSYNGVSIYQNGGTLGATGMAYKGNFFTGLTVNAGANAGEASLSNGRDNFSMLMAGIASKTGYNWELAKGKFIIQPSYLMSYSFINTFDYTNGNGARIDSDPLHAIQIEPGIKFIGNLKNGWQPYAGVSMVWNIMDQTHFKANNISLPELSVKPFVKYGVGVRKIWGDRFTGFVQTYITNGGRNGIGFQIGFRWALGK